MKLFLTLVVLLIAPGSLLAQSVVIDLGTGPVTIAPTANQVAAIQRLTDVENAQRAAENPPRAAITRETWLRNVMISAVQSYLGQAKKLDADDACTNYRAASAGVRSQIDTALGGKVVCP